MPPQTSLTDTFWILIDPWLFMFLSLTYLPTTVLSLIKKRDFPTLLSWSRLQAAWFGTFWAWAGSGVRQTGTPRVLPLLDGRVANGRETEKRIHEPVGGVVIEVGAGSGMWVDVFAQNRNGDAGIATGVESGALRKADMKVSKVYGVEPNKGSHDELRRRIKAAGLEGIYEVVPVGIESLSDPTKWPGKIEKGSVDCIVSILCLCSIPEPEKNIAELYTYLKPGGRWYVYEHVRHDKALGMRWYQGTVLSNIWGCLAG
jgi:SAM-dependent methyltransferase